jgi:hypothetical protein
VHPAALTLHRVPGDVSLALVVQALAAQEQRRFGGMEVTGGEIDLSEVGKRVALLDYAGRRLGVDHLVGDIADPGVVTALLYESAGAAPPLDEARGALHASCQADTEISGKLIRHLGSVDATLMARLDLMSG